MSLATVAIVLSSLGILVTGWLAAIFIINPVTGMAKVNHLPEFLPKVMTDRYIAFCLLAAGATFYGDLAVIAFLFAVFAYMAFADAALYRRAAKPFRPHFAAGVAAGIVSLVALSAHLTGAPS